MDECSDSAAAVTTPAPTRVRIRLVIGIGAALLLVKLWLAASLDLFGDESFYWLESRHLAPGYTDIPALLPWLLRLGTALAGDSVLGVRWPCLVLGTLVPWLVYLWARRGLDRDHALLAALLTLCVPLGALLGVLSLPDAPLTCAMLAAIIALDRAATIGRTRHWLLLGACLALGWLAHYRFVMFYVAGAAFVLGTPRGRALLARPGFWIAQAIGVLGLAPALWFNFLSGWSALRFQFVERHPWAFHADALIEPLVQLSVTTPLLFVLLVVGMLRALRERRAPYDLMGSAALGLLLGYLVLDCFADATHVRFHWPLPAYLIALPALPGVLASLRSHRGWRAFVAVAAPAMGAACTVLGLIWMANAARAPQDLTGAEARWVPDNLVGWSVLGEFGERERAAIGDDAVAIADNFLLGAEWAFRRYPQDAPYVLDHPLNTKHGRAGQLTLWGVDEAALMKSDWKRGLLLVEESSRRPIDVLPAYRELCPRFGRVEYRSELAMREGHTRVLSFAVEPGRDADKNGACVLPPLAYIDGPPPEVTVRGETVGVRGWAFSEFLGVASIELLVDGAPNGAATYGMDAPQVKVQWPSSADPHHPRVGFAGMLDLNVIAPGRHRLSLRVTDSAGHVRQTASQWFTKQGSGG